MQNSVARKAGALESILSFILDQHGIFSKLDFCNQPPSPTPVNREIR